MEEVLAGILERITPTEEEKLREDAIVGRIKSILEKKGVRPVLVGSLAKKTDLRADKDIDIFMLFPSDLSKEELKKRGLSVGKAVFDELSAEYDIDYAEHPYVKGDYEGYLIELVPCYDTKKPKSAVDRTPYHTRYVKSKIRQNPGLAGEIRLLKQFMKGAGVYGAEAKVEGFSGYLTELLVVSYGSFKETLDAASKWRFCEALDPENLWDDKTALKYFFPNASLIVVDPTDENRNVAAAVSRQRLAEFIVSASEFLKSCSADFFFPQPRDAPGLEELSQRLDSRSTALYAFVFRHGKINPNTLYSQLRKTSLAVERFVEGFGFRVLKSGVWTDEAALSIVVLEFEVWALPNIRQHVGPLIDSSRKDQEKFIEKHREFRPYIKEGRWVVDTRREHVDVSSLLEEIIAHRKGFGKNLRELEDISLVSGGDVLALGGDSFSLFLDSFLYGI